MKHLRSDARAFFLFVIVLKYVLNVTKNVLNGNKNKKSAFFLHFFAEKFGSFKNL